MTMITIYDQKINLDHSKSVLEAALGAGIYIPHLCHHPQLDSFSNISSIKRIYQGGVAHDGGEEEKNEEFRGCNLCLVEIEGHEGVLRSCVTMAEDGMSVRTDSPQLKRVREDNLAAILEKHPHACLLCPQGNGCDLKACSVHIPEDHRCCSQFGICELQKVAEYIGMERGLPPYVPLELPVLENEPLIRRNYNLCIGCLRCVRICKEVKGVDALGFVLKNGRLAVGSKEATLSESHCQFCGYCIEVCPTGALSDKNIGVGERETYLIPCKKSCPAEIDVPLYLRLIVKGKHQEALDIIRERAPLAGILGRVCFHPCETNCRRGHLDQPVAICDLKRFVADRNQNKFILPPEKKKRNKRVAVIGSGPAGLTAAYYLNRMGYEVIVFEALPVKGGMLQLGIPQFRLPRDILNSEIKLIEDTGVKIKTSHQVDSLEKLFLDGFDAIFVALGAHRGRELAIPGEENGGVVDGITFLKKVNLGYEVIIGEKVAVIGGGNVAFDSARCALRKGAKEVTVFYRRTRQEMPAYEEEIVAAMEEGIKIEYQVAPQKIKKTDTKFEVEFIRTKMGDFDKSLRRRPIPIGGSEHTLTFDTVVSAIGLQSEIPDGFGISLDNGTGVKVNPARGVYIGGDLLLGPSTVIDAIASGRKGAIHIDRFLGGNGNIDAIAAAEEPINLQTVNITCMDNDRVTRQVLSEQERRANFSEINLGLDEPIAITEAKRCLGCDMRFSLKPSILPPVRWQVLNEENIKAAPKGEGVYLLYDDKKEVYRICGVENIQEMLMEEYRREGPAKYFSYEENLMFTSKEIELIQHYMKKHGKMPSGNQELEELF